MDYESFEKAYSTNELAEILKVSSPSLRRWSIELEKAGYTFAKSKHNGKRLFVQSDVEMFKVFQKMVQDNNITTENASKLIVERFPKEVITGQSLSVQPENSENIQLQQSIIDYMEQMKDEIFTRLDEREQKEKEYIAKRDQSLVESMRATLDTKKEVAELKELVQTLVEQSATKEKKSFWSRIFKK